MTNFCSPFSLKLVYEGFVLDNLEVAIRSDPNSVTRAAEVIRHTCDEAEFPFVPFHFKGLENT